MNEEQQEEQHFAVLIRATAGIPQADSFPLTIHGPNLVQRMSRTQHFLLHNETVLLVHEHLDPAVEKTSRQ